VLRLVSDLTVCEAERDQPAGEVELVALAVRDLLERRAMRR
jgi:hypothetical protein